MIDGVVSVGFSAVEVKHCGGVGGCRLVGWEELKSIIEENVKTTRRVVHVDCVVVLSTTNCQVVSLHTAARSSSSELQTRLNSIIQYMQH